MTSSSPSLLENAEHSEAIPATTNIESALRQRLGASSGSLCIASSTGVVLGVGERIDLVRKQQMPMGCFWGAFVK